MQDASTDRPDVCGTCLRDFGDRDSHFRLDICRHSFHLGCIIRHCLQYETCPTCQVPITFVDRQNLQLPSAKIRPPHEEDDTDFVSDAWIWKGTDLPPPSVLNLTNVLEVTELLYPAETEAYMHLGNFTRDQIHRDSTLKDFYNSIVDVEYSARDAFKKSMSGLLTLTLRTLEYVESHYGAQMRAFLIGWIDPWYQNDRLELAIDALELLRFDHFEYRLYRTISILRPPIVKQENVHSIDTRIAELETLESEDDIERALDAMCSEPNRQRPYDWDHGIRSSKGMRALSLFNGLGFPPNPDFHLPTLLDIARLFHAKDVEEIRLVLYSAFEKVGVECTIGQFYTRACDREPWKERIIYSFLGNLMLCVVATLEFALYSFQEDFYVFLIEWLNPLNGKLPLVWKRIRKIKKLNQVKKNIFWTLKMF